jgi:reactive intermediate/imine deaminase
MKLVESGKAPAAIGPYSQAWIVGNLIFTSGQLPVNPENGNMPSDITAQCEQSCRNIMAILTEAGTDMSKVIKTTCYLSDIADFASFNQAYANYFTNKPARSCFAVKDLPKGALCEIEVIAEI